MARAVGKREQLLLRQVLAQVQRPDNHVDGDQDHGHDHQPAEAAAQAGKPQGVFACLHRKQLYSVQADIYIPMLIYFA